MLNLKHLLVYRSGENSQQLSDQVGTRVCNLNHSAVYNLNFDLLSSFCVKAEGFVVNVNQLAVFDVFGIMDTTGLYVPGIPFIKIYFPAVRNKAVG